MVLGVGGSATVNKSVNLFLSLHNPYFFLFPVWHSSLHHTIPDAHFPWTLVSALTTA